MSARKSLEQRAVEAAHKAWNCSAATWDGNEARRLIVAAYIAGYRAAKRELRK